ncbi:MAG: hypothetical protein F4060_09545 [Holophagales bacterium]|nr:hypothetical protein [Holophagales bacterium]MYG32215.1 hypothetical protein [Holophagales bacterium]MYI80176.1 hypothetical protein [Holophagales bacterium]
MQQLGGLCRCAGRQAGSLLAAVLLTTPAAAIVYVLPTDDSMVERSGTIVYGEVLSASPSLREGSAFTDYAFEVEEVLKGLVPGGTIVVRQPGGPLPGGIATRIQGLPMLAEGDRVLLFLDPLADAYGPVELALGIFFEVRTARGPLLVREPSLGGEVTLPGDPAAAERARARLPRDSSDFRRWIADRAAGVERSADYFVVEPPDGPIAVRSPFTATRSPDECFHDGLPLRWREFDSGGSAGFTVQAGGQPGVPGGGLSQVRTAMRAWNDVSDSRANLVLHGTSNRDFEIDTVDGVNSITYEDPFDEIEGTFRPNEGGVLAITSAFFYCDASEDPHPIPGNRSVEALELIESNVTTQDGFGDWLALTPVPRENHEEIMAHELGHAIGIGHSCGDARSGSCDAVTREAIMRAQAHGDGRGARLNSDDRAAVRFLYPVPLPEPPQAPGYTDCRPEAAALVFADGFKVAVCYETASGEVGEGKAGIWASGESGLLWFFNRDNAEVLVKVLDGCRLNGNRWVYVAPVTDLAFNLYVQSAGGSNWSHHNRQGETAASRSDNFAFPCN